MHVYAVRILYLGPYSKLLGGGIESMSITEIFGGNDQSIHCCHQICSNKFNEHVYDSDNGCSNDCM